MSFPIAITKLHENFFPDSTLSTTAKAISLPGVPIKAETTKWIHLTSHLISNRYKFFIPDHFSNLNEGEPTLLAADGSSVMDLCTCYGHLFDICKHILFTDEFAELFTRVMFMLL